MDTSKTIQLTDPATGLTNKQAHALAQLSARAVAGIFYSRDIRELCITDGTLRALRERGYVRQVLPSVENGFRCYYQLPGAPDAPAKERYWSGSTDNREGAAAADVFVDGSEIRLGVHDGTTGIRIELSTADALKLSGMLTEAAARAEDWRLP